MPEKDIVWHCHVQKGATKKKGWWCIEAVERKMSCFFFKMFLAISCKRCWNKLYTNLILMNDVKGRYFLGSKWEELAQKGGISSLKKRSFSLARTWATQVGSTQRFLRFFCWPCSSASMDALFVQQKIVGCGHEKTMKTWTQTIRVSKQETTIGNKHQPRYLEYLRYLYQKQPFDLCFYPDPVSVLTRYHKGFQRILTCGSYSSEEAGGSETLVSQKLKHNRRRRHNQNTTYVVEWLVELPIYT